MGKGDKKTKRGKIIMGSYGVRRPRKSAPARTFIKVEKIEEPVKPLKEKAPAKAKAEKEEIPVVMEVAPALAEETPKASRKKAPAKSTEKKEVKSKAKTDKKAVEKSGEEGKTES